MITSRLSRLLLAALIVLSVAPFTRADDPNQVVALSITLLNPGWGSTGPGELVVFKLRAVNSNGQTVPGYRGTVSFSSNDPLAELPSPHTFTAANAGEWIIGVTFAKALSVTLSASDGQVSGSIETWSPCWGFFTRFYYEIPFVCPGLTTRIAVFTTASDPKVSWTSRQDGSIVYGGIIGVDRPGTWDVIILDQRSQCSERHTVGLGAHTVEVTAPQHAYGDFIASVNGNFYTDSLFWSVTSATILSGQGTPVIHIRPDPGATAVDIHFAGEVWNYRLCRLLADHRTVIEKMPIVTVASLCALDTRRTASVPEEVLASAYAWSIDGGEIVEGADSRTVVYDVHRSGTVTLTVAVTFEDGTVTTVTRDIPVDSVSATVTGDAKICPGDLSTVAVSLAGTPPFRILWSDGVEQIVIGSYSTSRTVSPPRSQMYSIFSVSDGNCSDFGTGAALVEVSPPPEITRHPRSHVIGHGQTATLLVEARGSGLRYAWYEVLANGSLQRVASATSPVFTTPPLTRTTIYRAEVVNACGMVQSNEAVIGIAGRRRSARH